MLIEVTPTIETAAYAAGDQVCQKIEIKLPFPDGYLTYAAILDKDGEEKALNLKLFNADYTAVTVNTTYVMAAADEGKVITTLNFTTWETQNTGVSVSEVTNIEIPVKAYKPTGVRVYYLPALLLAGEAVTYTATTDLVIRLNIVDRWGY